jgi:orotidine-5'-phosphate decarboxylase
MLRAAAEVQPRPKLWGVTVLTSMKDTDLRPLHPHAKVSSMVKNLARLGWVNGIDGTICSGQEVQYLRKTLKHLDMKFVTPGIRPAGAAANDQKRVMTPEQAAVLGIDYIVIGRPITHAADPLKAAQDILSSMKHEAPRSLELR